MKRSARLTLAVILALLMLSLLPTLTSCSLLHTHEFGEWTTVTEPTCTVPGEQQRNCECGELEREAIAAIGHTEVVDAAVDATCTKDGRTEGSHCSVCGETIVAQECIKRLGHTRVIEVEVPATCTEEGRTEAAYCSTCHKTFVTSTVIQKSAHTKEVIPAIPATCTAGWSEGIRCSVCQTVIKQPEPIAPIHSYRGGRCTQCGDTHIDYSDVRMYASHDAYAFFETVENGAAMRALYDKMEEAATKFHNGAGNATLYDADNYAVARLYFNPSELDHQEAVTVFYLFRNDHHVFYWLTSHYYCRISSTSSILLTTTKEYANAEDRIKYNEILYKGIEEYALLTQGETSAYNIALIYYDAIMARNTYAYNDAHKAETALWAHSVMGDFLYGKFVCEGYATMFHLLLNLNNIENVYVHGTGKTAQHVWNLARMDDGNWYWFDITWGDGNKDPYKYFCVPGKTFQNHTPTPAGTYGVRANTIPPEPATSAFKSDDVLELKFTVGGSTYVRTSATTVKRISVQGLPIGSKIEYQGVIYDIAA